MARPDKAAAVAEIVEQFNDSAGAVLTEYRGLTVKQLQELRRSLGEHASYAVVKNTLTKLAAKEAGVEGLDDLLTGPTAIAFINGDLVEAYHHLLHSDDRMAAAAAAVAWSARAGAGSNRSVMGVSGSVAARAAHDPDPPSLSGSGFHDVGPVAIT